MMKVKILVTALMLMGMAPAQANGCPSGVCDVEVNCTTGVVTYRDAPPRHPVINNPPIGFIAPTHTLAVQTSTQSMGISGTTEQIAATVTTMVERVSSVPIDPCVNGGCTRIEVNATTQEVKIIPLTMTEIRQQTDNRVRSTIQQAEIAKKATQALPNIQEINSSANQVELTPLLEEEPDWWADFIKAIGEFYFWYNNVNWWSI
jgi:hypothetical protein